jgi:ADP-ribose pyrophosphatase YjhB (NUDIX family)
MIAREYFENHGAPGKKLLLLLSKRGYSNMEGAVVAIVNYHGKILVGKKKTDSLKFLAGKWHIPGETVLSGEDDKAALIRGIREEAGIGIIIGDYIGKSKTPSSKEARWYECFAHTDHVVASSDLEDILWLRKEFVLPFLDMEVKKFWPKELVSYFYH